MFCYKCGYKANDKDKFCKQCGTILRPQTVERKTIKLTCEDCSGILEVDPERPILSCPYCGSKKLIQESDEVVIARINKAADAERMRHEKEMKEYEEEIRLKKKAENEKLADEDWRLLKKFMFICAVITILCFSLLK